MPTAIPPPGDGPVFPPVAKSHVLNCSFHSWYPRFAEITPPVSLIPLSAPFLSYLRSDGIVLPSDDPPALTSSDDDHDSGVFSAPPSEGELHPDNDEDIAAGWRDVHERIRSTIASLGGSVYPKLNWSAPKDAVWITTNRSMACQTPLELYLLLKSSDFISHDLFQVFDGTFDDSVPVPAPKKNRVRARVRFCDVVDVSDMDSTLALAEPAAEPKVEIVADTTTTISEQESHRDANGVAYHLVLRQSIPELNPALEFRCFVRDRKLIGITQRDRSYSPFLFRLRPRLDHEIRIFFHTHIRHSFPDPSFAFDVYVPEPYNRVWLIDVNPWAPRTDSLLFDWEELLTMDSAPDVNDSDAEDDPGCSLELSTKCVDTNIDNDDDDDDADQFGSSKLPSAVNSYDPHFRLVRKGDPSGWAVAAAQYSANKLPQDVLDASSCRPGDRGLREFAAQWFGQGNGQRRWQRSSYSDSDSGSDSDMSTDLDTDSGSDADSDSDADSSESESDSDDDFETDGEI